ncbi:MAG: TIGR00730 family Rossman fold protein [Pseudomonadales bacterium]|nr:TIGR00730 family Rossman fold protein [Pseudomonadales bacterium]
MPARKRVCVYCGSSPGHDPVFLDSAEQLGAAIARHGFDLVYGGASIGLMGAVADAALEHGAAVYGVMPRSLAEKEIAHDGLTELIITSSMHDRKEKMADLSDGFIALPGGLGTLEELFEIWTWSQLGFHGNPIGLLNVADFYDALLAFLTSTVEAGFVKQPHRDILLVDDNPDALLRKILEYRASIPPKVGLSPDQR